MLPNLGHIRGWHWVMLFLCLLSIGCERVSIHQTRPLMGTLVEIEAYGGKEPLEAAFAEMERLEALLSSYSPGSDISRLSSAKSGKLVEVSPEAYEVIKESVRWSVKTDGAFDVTVGALLKLWGFTKKEGRVPDEEEIAEILPSVGYGKIALGEEGLTIGLEAEGMALDLGGVAKGYIVDRAVEVLKREGITSARVDAGGDLYLLGSPPKKRFWRIGVQHPRREEILAVLKIKDGAVVTSGDYRNFFTIGGKRYCHIIDPRSGYPPEGVLSVTVLAERTADADALATGIFVLGAARGIQLTEGLEGFEALIVSEEKGKMKVAMTSGMPAMIIGGREGLKL